MALALGCSAEKRDTTTHRYPKNRSLKSSCHSFRTPGHFLYRGGGGVVVLRLPRRQMQQCEVRETAFLGWRRCPLVKSSSQRELGGHALEPLDLMDVGSRTSEISCCCSWPTVLPVSSLPTGAIVCCRLCQKVTHCFYSCFRQ